MDKYIPKNKYTHTNSSKGKPVWMTRQVLKAVKRKHKSWKNINRQRSIFIFNTSVGTEIKPRENVVKPE